MGTLLLTSIAAGSAARALEAAPTAEFLFAQLTDNSENDWLPRVSGAGLVGPSRYLVTWAGAHQLPEAASASTTDLEVFLWDGAVLEQVTDDDAASTRPVVNNHAEIAFQTGGNDEGNDLAVRSGDQCWRVTSDPNRDRYPDLNDNGIVVWGHYSDDTRNFGFSSYDLRRRYWFHRSLVYSYRPHINAANQVEVTAAWLRFPDAKILAFGPRPADHGYALFRRAELNDLGWMLIEADPNPASQNAHDLGPRDMLLWNGTALRRVHSSPNDWAGRGDLNRRGLLVWEGRGGLPTSTSGRSDTEIFVFDPARGVVEQLTDDDADDSWPTVMDDDTIVWMGQGNLPGARGAASDFEIFLACPDRDGDGMGDRTPRCGTASGSRQIQIQRRFVSPSARDCERPLPVPGPALGSALLPALGCLVWMRRRRRSHRLEVGRVARGGRPG